MIGAEFRQAAAKLMSEKQLQEDVIALAHALGWRHFHPFDSRRSVAGFPDLTLTRAGRLIFAELKTERGKTTPAQDAWLADLNLVPGAEVHLWRPTQLLDGTIKAALT